MKYNIGDKVVINPYRLMEALETNYMNVEIIDLCTHSATVVGCNYSRVVSEEVYELEFNVPYINTQQLIDTFGRRWRWLSSMLIPISDINGDFVKIKKTRIGE